MEEHPRHHFDLSPLFVGLIGILCGAILVATFHCLAVGCCGRRPQTNRPHRNTSQDSAAGRGGAASSRSSPDQVIKLYRYSIEMGIGGDCAVCLSEFTEGEEVQVLPECGHSFHARCINLWLRSNPSCPLCRAGTTPPPPYHVAMALRDSAVVPPTDYGGS
ncbi:RING-H2 finger protein ATL51-like [Diospyros lotus]|uniref:RING-H2 finger protein ATL51-like n=1 Tax=Diospyros lotus TaxID=55363 RepID=UPI00225ADC1E|nr:RING-H2 finger protein ATL51-like [Diospyros lotus]